MEAAGSSETSLNTIRVSKYPDI